MPVHVRINGREVSAPIARGVLTVGVLLVALVVFFVILPLIGIAIAAAIGIAAGTAIAIGAARLLGAKRSDRERLPGSDGVRRLHRADRSDNLPNDDQ